MNVDGVKAALELLRQYYTDKRTGKAPDLNDVQKRVYTALLGRYDTPTLERACYAWMAKSPFFPAASDLRDAIEPTADGPAQAHLAWAAVERAIRQAGIYRGATFENGAVGETMRQTFGSWARACQFELDSPGWAIRRQTFLALYPSIAARRIGPVTLRGLHPTEPLAIGAIEGLAAPAQLPAATPDEPLSRHEAKDLLAEIQQRSPKPQRVIREWVK